ncbi:MAG TPA: hypothetical protein VKE94_02495 [Gemmataceae bacterium]|nr:hypothetical protein [Gemmataceae bacterium]
MIFLCENLRNLRFDSRTLTNSATTHSLFQIQIVDCAAGGYLGRHIACGEVPGRIAMKWLPCLLICLLLVAQTDDAWTPIPVSEPASIAADDDSYLPAPRRLRDEGSAEAQSPLVAALPWQAADFTHIQKGVATESHSKATSPRPLLYVFMSLQI